MSQLALFVAKTCSCLRGDQGESEGHDGHCVWVCLTCDDAFTCDPCRMDLMIEDLEPAWNASLGRQVVTVQPLYGLFDGQPWHLEWTLPRVLRRADQILARTAAKDHQ